MKQPVAVVDTGVVILLVFPAAPNESEELRVRRARTEVAVEALQKNGAKLLLPTPVIAELSREGPGSQVCARLVSQLKRRVRTEPLDVDAADVAGAMRRVALSQRAGTERGAVSYDALIAAIAHRVGARWLATTNPADMARCLRAIGSPVEVVDTTGIPTAGQLSLVHQGARKAEPGGLA